MPTKTYQLTVNGSSKEIEFSTGATLLELLRDGFGFMGTKEGCGKGDCGACTVLLDNMPILSCIYPAEKAINKKVTTIEGLGTAEKLHPVQKAFVDYGAVQCGFCTPGMVMAAVGLLYNNPNPSEDEIKESISGNICRCTGYKKIIEAIKMASESK